MTKTPSITILFLVVIAYSAASATELTEIRFVPTGTIATERGIAVFGQGKALTPDFTVMNPVGPRWLCSRAYLPGCDERLQSIVDFIPAEAHFVGSYVIQIGGQSLPLRVEVDTHVKRPPLVVEFDCSSNECDGSLRSVDTPSEINRLTAQNGKAVCLVSTARNEIAARRAADDLEARGYRVIKKRTDATDWGNCVMPGTEKALRSRDSFPHMRLIYATLRYGAFPNIGFPSEHWINDPDCDFVVFMTIDPGK